MWCAALSHAMSRFEGCRPLYKQARSGGVGSFTADNFPVFDYLKPNVYGILDSNHGYKMIGVGREVARVLLRRHRAAPDAVPVRALRDRRPPPGLELAISLELEARQVLAHFPGADLLVVAEPLVALHARVVVDVVLVAAAAERGTEDLVALELADRLEQVRR